MPTKILPTISALTVPLLPAFIEIAPPLLFTKLELRISTLTVPLVLVFININLTIELVNIDLAILILATLFELVDIWSTLLLALFPSKMESIISILGSSVSKITAP
ncbi:hypothetical protein MBCUT_17120 [Methanobrevibacter cuticularis]|uniref:Uncharacterized protein n=1 Tax=Methanobrevibacter cuticularis TaxID=47311 RepID=A0A166D1M1_9EURY|nr:hypothetical protein MBCUT_17120 [Methanobrevibacter cuticularis]